MPDDAQQDRPLDLPGASRLSDLIDEFTKTLDEDQQDVWRTYLTRTFLDTGGDPEKMKRAEADFVADLKELLVQERQRRGSADKKRRTTRSESKMARVLVAKTRCDFGRWLREQGIDIKED